MAKFPFSFRSGFGRDDKRRDLALATNFDKAATEEYVDAAVAAGGGGGGGAPSGPAGGVLGGTYPNPAFAVDMATQVELDAEATTRGSADTTLQTNITSEASTRASADLAEVEARSVADVAVQQDVDDLAEDFQVHHHDGRYYTKPTNDALLAAYLTTAAAASTYAPLVGPTFTGTVTASGATAVTVPTVAIAAGSNAASIGAVNTALGAYLTTASATATYLTIATAASTYLTTATAASTYLTVATAASTYLPTATATATYATLTSLATAIADRAAGDVAVQQDIDDLAEDFQVHHHDSRYRDLWRSYRGAWSASTQYAVGDVVIYAGHSLIATSIPLLGDTPYGNSAGVWDYSAWGGTVWGGANGWTYLAARGATGATGASGAGSASTVVVVPAGRLVSATDAQTDLARLEQGIDDIADDLGSHHHDDRYLTQALLTTRGDLVRRGASALERVALGTSGQVLGSDGTDAVWQNPMLPVWTTIAQASGRLGGTTTVGTYAMIPGAVGTSPVETYGSPINATFNFDGADYAVTGKTAQYRIHVAPAFNATAAGASCTFEFGISAISAFGGASGTSVTATFAAAPSGNAATIGNPAAGYGAPINSTVFTSLTQSAYLFVVRLSGASMAAASCMTCSIQLQVRHV